MPEPILNAHNKDEYPPAHTCEHILNRTMVNMFGCPRSRSSHIERRKSKCDYILDACPSEEQVLAVSANVNAVIARALPVTARLVTREEAAGLVDLSKLPADASETLRIVSVGNTSEIGEFKILSHDFHDGVWRIRWKVIPR